MAREGKLAVFPSLSWFEALQDNVAEDRELAVSGRWSTLNFALQVGEDVFLVRLREGRIEEIIQEPGGSESWSFAFVGSPEDWRRFLQKSPPSTTSCWSWMYGSPPSRSRVTSTCLYSISGR
ncbi:MAG TPA: hypothetical protein VFE21_05935 [Rubrobacteraceae bacterium]|nr:hypothetical protein [Rubrobacteraceae bacterium]